jgi:polysaccharide pyruvyl transferase WcaK-like protein
VITLLDLVDKPWRFLIGGVRFGNNNVGDEAILQGIVKVLRSICPHCEITVLTDQPARTAACLGVKTFRYSLIKYRAGLLHRILEISSRVLMSLFHTFIAMRTDIIICAGGTMLSDCPGDILRLAGLGIFAQTRLVYFPGGMNPGKSQEVLKQLRDIIREFDLFMLRDTESKKLLVAAGCNPKSLHVTADPAFNAGLDGGGQTTKPTSSSSSSWTVGIGISHEPDCADHNNAAEWAKIGDFIIDQLKVRIMFLPSNTEEDKDIAVMDDVHRRMKRADAATVFRNELSPQEMVSAISGYEMMISSRMHQLIFSLLADKPFVAVSRCAKTDNFCSMLGIKSAVSTQECTIDRIRPVLEATWTRRNEIRKENRRSKEAIMQKAYETQRLIHAYLSGLEDQRKVRRPLDQRIRYLCKAFTQRMSV